MVHEIGGPLAEEKAEADLALAAVETKAVTSSRRRATRSALCTTSALPLRLIRVTLLRLLLAVLVIFLRLIVLQRFLALF